jgi:4-amino-4-deoxy-L-arabinose transferase-like glycosyltransferase
MWAAFGSAILIKGPQIPLLLLLAIVYYAWRHCGGWSAVRAFYPARGLMLVAAIALPWFLVLRLRLGGDTLGGSQLSGALLLPSVAHVLNGYYLYRPLQLVLPWLPLVLAAGWALLTIRPQPDGLTRFLLISIVFVLGGLSLGSQQRYFYALPVWPAAALVLGRGLEILRASRPRWFSIVCNLQALIIAAAAAWMCSQVAAWAALVVVAFLLGTSVRVQSLRVPLMCLAVVVLFVRFADSPMLWSADRFARAGFAETVSRIVPPQAPLVAYKLTPAIYIQASGRSIPALRDLAQLRQWRDGDTGSVRYVLTLPKFRREILTAFQVRTLVAMPRSVGDAAVLYQVELSSN